MIVKLFSENSPSRPLFSNTEAVNKWRTSVLNDISGKISVAAFEKISEKFLKPQQWRATATPVTKGANIAQEDEMTIEGIANAADPDRGRELILNSAWKTENYDANPIILFNHNHNWPIGNCVEYRVEDQGLYYRASIGKPSAYPCLTDTQVMVRSLLAQGILRASSVGFLPINIEYDEENDILRYTEVELLEISLVSIPMQQGSLLDSVGTAAKSVNPNAINKGVKSMDSAQFDELKALLQKVLDAVAAKETPPAQTEGCGDQMKEENKSLKQKIEELKALLDAEKKDKEELEKSVVSLIESLKKQGIKVES